MAILDGLLSTAIGVLRVFVSMVMGVKHSGGYYNIFNNFIVIIFLRKRLSVLSIDISLYKIVNSKLYIDRKIYIDSKFIKKIIDILIL